MDDRTGGSAIRKRARRTIVSAALVAGGLAAGGMLAGASLANAAGSATSTASGAASTASSGAMGSPMDVAHGPGEQPLTGSTASKVTAAAEAAVPNGTVIRVETDSEGSPYEAHVQKADGSVVTLKIDDSFQVTSTIEGFGAGGPMQGPANDA
jgi:hypothetical protein